MNPTLAKGPSQGAVAPTDTVSSSAQELQVKTLVGRADAARWDAYVERVPQATFFHLSAWQEVVKQAYDHPTHYLYAERNGVIEGVLPLGHIRSWLFGNALVSTPFCVYGGIVADSDDVSAALRRAALALATGLRVDYLELRQREDLTGTPPANDLYVTFRKSICADHDENMKAIPRKQRAMVRKGIKANLDDHIDTDVDRFFPLYAVSLRNLGTPIMSRRWFELLLTHFQDRADVLTVTHNGMAVASVMSFYFREEVLPYYAGSNHAARNLKAHDFMYWRLMCRAADRGCTSFDYGRSKRDTGSFNFKRNWGFEPTPLHYEYQLVRATHIPDINPLNPKYRLMIETWKRLPVSLSTIVGPWVARYLG